MEIIGKHENLKISILVLTLHTCLFSSLFVGRALALFNCKIYCNVLSLVTLLYASRTVGIVVFQMFGILAPIMSSDPTTPPGILSFKLVECKLYGPFLISFLMLTKLAVNISGLSLLK